MMHGREKSDSAIVAVKPTNKAVPAAAEPVEPRFTALLHHISIDCLQMAFFALKRDAASGVDGLTWPTYEADLDRNLTDLHERVHRGAALSATRSAGPRARNMVGRPGIQSTKTPSGQATMSAYGGARRSSAEIAMIPSNTTKMFAASAAARGLHSGRPGQVRTS
jgi:hypothetical protein